MDRKWIYVAIAAVILYYAYKHGMLNSFLHSSGGTGGGRG